MIQIPQGQPIPFTWTFPDNSGITANNFDEVDNAVAYLYTDESKKVKFSLIEKDGFDKLKRIDAMTLYGQITKSQSKKLAEGELKIEVAVVDTNETEYPDEAGVVPVISTGIMIIKSTIKEAI